MRVSHVSASRRFPKTPRVVYTTPFRGFRGFRGLRYLYCNGIHGTTRNGIGPRNTRLHNAGATWL